MRLGRPAARPAPEPLVPLIDVVFFLLVFFLLVGRLDATAPFELRPPAGEGADLPAGGAALSLSVDGALALDRQTLPREAALSALERRIGLDPDLRVRLEADRDAPLRELLPLIAALEDLGARDVVLVVARGR